MTTSTVDRAALFNLFSHVKETLLCLRASNGEISSNKAFGQARMKLAKEIKAHIEYKSGEETFNVANLNCGEFKGAVASLNVAELRKTLTDHGVLGKASEKRARSVHVLEVEAVGTPVHAGRAKKKSDRQSIEPKEKQILFYFYFSIQRSFYDTPHFHYFFLFHYFSFFSFFFM